MSAAPPRLAVWLVRRAAAPDEARYVANDLLDLFEARLAADGPAAARRAVWAEALRSCPPLFWRRWHTARPTAPSARDSMWSSIVADARHALRLGARTPVASLAIVATMMLGVGSTTAVFSAMHAVLLQPLPFAGSERVVQLRGTLRDGRVTPSLAYPDLLDFRRFVPDFADIGVFQQTTATLQHGADPRLLHGVQADEGYARVLHVGVFAGRQFASADFVVNGAKVALLSYACWMREFGGDRAVVGSTIKLDDESVQVVGVLAPQAYTYPVPDADIVTPLVIFPNSIMTRRGAMWSESIARLAPGATLAQASRDLASAARLLATEHADANSGIGAVVRPLRDAVTGSVESMLELLAAAVAAVLLIACVNIANLILGRAQTRTREFAVRSALGGSPARVRQQVFTESLTMAALGGVLGVAIAPLLTRALIAAYPGALPRAGEIAVNFPVLALATLATVIAGAPSALPAARRAGRLNLSNDLRDGGRSGSGRGDRIAGRVLIATQVATSLALLFAASLLLQTFWRLTRENPGFVARDAVAFHVFASNARYPAEADIDRYFTSATRALEAIPGVQAVSSTTLLPFGGGRRSDVFIRDDVGDRGPDNPQVAVATVAPGFERALGVPLLRGRAFTPADDSASAPVVMIDETVATHTFAGVDPVGRTIAWGATKHWTIIGVVGAVHLDNLWEAPTPVLYTLARQVARRSRHFVIRSALPPDQIVSAARAALRAVDPTIAITDPLGMEQRVRDSLGAQRFRAALMATIGALALGLAVIGIYGVVSYAVARRVREIGIRMALGEHAGGVMRRVVGDALRVAAIGVAAGVVLALAAGRWLASFLVGVSATDVPLLGMAAAALVALVVAAAAVPARRAARVDPVTALRGD